MLTSAVYLCLLSSRSLHSICTLSLPLSITPLFAVADDKSTKQGDMLIMCPNRLEDLLQLLRTRRNQHRLIEAVRRLPMCTLTHNSTSLEHPEFVALAAEDEPRLPRALSKYECRILSYFRSSPFPAMSEDEYTTLSSQRISV